MRDDVENKLINIIEYFKSQSLNYITKYCVTKIPLLIKSY